MTTNNDAAIDAWMQAREPGKEITNADLISLLSLLPPDAVPVIEDPNGIYGGAKMTRSYLSVGEKSFRLYIASYDPPSTGRQKEDSNAD